MSTEVGLTPVCGSAVQTPAPYRSSWSGDLATYPIGYPSSPPLRRQLTMNPRPISLNGILPPIATEGVQYSATRNLIGRMRSVTGSCDDVKRLSYDVVTGRRVVKLRSSCLRSYAAGVRDRSERCMHSDRRVVKDEAQYAPRPSVPTSEAASGEQGSILGPLLAAGSGYP